MLGLNSPGSTSIMVETRIGCTPRDKRPSFSNGTSRLRKTNLNVSCAGPRYIYGLCPKEQRMHVLKYRIQYSGYRTGRVRGHENFITYLPERNFDPGTRWI